MTTPKVIDACQKLFSISSYLANGIIHALRIEDIKIALAKQLRKNMVLAPDKKTYCKPDDFLESYNILADYINQYNMDVILALEYYSNSKPSEESYLFPFVGCSKNTSIKNNNALSKKSIFFKGNLPPRKLRLGTFLYYKGLVSYYDVLESIAWQKDRRPLLGQIAMQTGFLSTENFARSIIYVKNGNCIGTIARKNKFLSENVIAAIVKIQEKYDCRIGRYFMEKGILSNDNVFELNEEMIDHNMRYSDITQKRIFDLKPEVTCY